MLQHCQDAFGLAAAGRKRQRCNTIGNGRMERIVVAVGVWRRLGGAQHPHDGRVGERQWTRCGTVRMARRRGREGRGVLCALRGVGVLGGADACRRA